MLGSVIQSFTRALPWHSFSQIVPPSTLRIFGVLAQLVERLYGIQKVRSSSLLYSTSLSLLFLIVKLLFDTYNYTPASLKSQYVYTKLCEIVGIVSRGRYPQHGYIS